ncbi:MAG: transposase [Candidatus Babeliaceae bacterium]|nr:transposase [Candidatus Babeliaceae bacterium]
MPELATIFRDWRMRLSLPLSKEQIRAIHDICACRTPEVGHQMLYLCPNCGDHHLAWQSCGNRNCPKCGNDKVTKWLAKRQNEMLPIDYFMITMTLPSELHHVCLSFPRKVYKAFFAAASESIKELAIDKRFLGANVGMIGTLQTWRRDGEFHPHIHFLIPGGGISKDGKYWVFPRTSKFLVHSKPLMKLFKGKLKALLESLGFLEHIPPSIWRKPWVGDCKNVGNGMSSFKYIGPYTQRVFISNNRIEDYDGENVTFRYTNSKTNETTRRTMHAKAFIYMFLRHVLPSGFQKTRYYGILGSACKGTLREIRLLILTSRSQPPPEPEVFEAPPILCKKCGTEMLRRFLLSTRGPPQKIAS